jgi:hypothetical protein
MSTVWQCKMFSMWLPATMWKENLRPHSNYLRKSKILKLFSILIYFPRLYFVAEWQDSFLMRLAIYGVWPKYRRILKKKNISNNFFGAPKLRNSEKEQVGAPTVPSAVIWVPTEFDDFCVIGHQMCHMRPFSNRFQKSLEHGMCILKSTQKQNYPSIPKVVPALDKHAHSKKGVQRIFDRDLF